MIPPEFIQSLLARVDIIDIVERYVPLKRAGANYSACCPFHNEKTPSFTVSPSKQFYHCFGCGAHGTAISFLIEHQGLSFVEAIKDLASHVGMVVPESQAPRGPVKDAAGNEVSVESIYEALRTAMHYFKGQLKQSERAIAYLKQRGVSGEVAAKYGLGYAPEGWQGLAAAFSNYQSPFLLQVGLVIDSQEGRRYDRFRDRVMFPIQDPKGNVIGFGGRVMGDGEPKYLNSPETPVFEKGRELYGLLQARRAIRDGGEVIVVEGYMDVVGLAQHGVENVVATLGTATTGLHVHKLLRQADHIIFSFDGDRAGRAAAWRALENCLPELADKKQISFLFLPEEHDPDSFIREFGRDAFTEKLRHDAVPFADFLIRELRGRVKWQSEEGRAEFVANAKSLLDQITKAPQFALQLQRRIGNVLEWQPQEIDRQFGVRATAPRRAAPMPRSVRRAPSLARRLLKCLVADPNLALDPALVSPEEPTIEGDVVPLLIGFIRSSSVKVNTAILMHALSESPHERLLSEIQSDILTEWGEGFDIQAEFHKVLADMAERERERKIEALLKKSEKESWTEADKNLYRQLIAAKV